MSRHDKAHIDFLDLKNTTCEMKNTPNPKKYRIQK